MLKTDKTYYVVVAFNAFGTSSMSNVVVVAPAVAAAKKPATKKPAAKKPAAKKPARKRP
jgi:hypothetical protein